MPHRELLRLYFKTLGDRNYVFFGVNPENPEQELTLYDIANTPIVRHGMVTNRNPYLPENYEYFQKRVKSQTLVPTAWSNFHFKILRKSHGMCLVCNQPINLWDKFEVHHVKPIKAGGSDHIRNLLMLHTNCHKVVTHTCSPKLMADFEAKGIIKR